MLAAAGRKVWDATSMDVREHFPTDRDALRIVQYDSCRGLEGWTVINYAFDEFWDYKYRQWLAASQEPGNPFDTPEERARAFASCWAMIPLTRAMDTLVINVSARPGTIRDALEKVHRDRTDFEPTFQRRTDAAAIGDRRPGRQNRSGRYCFGAERHL